MKNANLLKGILVAVAMLASSVCFAQSAGQATYNAKCKSCHGADGAADSSVAKMMKVKPVSDPEIKKLTAAQMFTGVKDGKGKMKPFKDKLTDDEIKGSVAYYRSLIK